MVVTKHIALYLVTFLVTFIASAIICGCGTHEQFSSNSLQTDVFTQSYTDHKYDFIWVVDNSGSMVDRLTYVHDNLDSFIDTMSQRKAVDYNMVFVTTDYFTDVGNLRDTALGETVISSADPQARTKLKEIVQRIIDQINNAPSSSSFWERPHDSLYAAIQNHGSTFMRNQADLFAILFSDEDSYDCGLDSYLPGHTTTACSGGPPETNANYVRKPKSFFLPYFYNSKATVGRKFNYVPIVAQNLTDCTVSSTGAHYMDFQDDMVNLYNSVNMYGSICQTSFGAGIAKVTSYVGDRGFKFTLSRHATGLNISVTVDGTLVDIADYSFDAASNSIIFNGNGFVPPNGALVQVTYGM